MYNYSKEIREIYEKSTSLESIYAKIRKNKDLFSFFKDKFEKTVYFKNVKKAYQQCLYNILNNIDEFPKYSNGALKIFKSLKEGYYSQEEFEKGLCKSYINHIYDKNLFFAALKFLNKTGHVTGKKGKEFFEEYFGKENYKIIGKHAVMYFQVGLKEPLYCEICGNLIKYPTSDVHLCHRKNCKIAYDLRNKTFEECKDVFKELFKKEKRAGFITYSILKKAKNIADECEKLLLKDFPKEKILKMSTNQKMYHLLNDIHSIPLCPVCKENDCSFDNGENLYNSTCSHECSNRFIDNIEKRLKNNRLHSNVGLHEEIIINDLFPETNLKKMRIRSIFARSGG